MISYQIMEILCMESFIRQYHDVWIPVQHEILRLIPDSVNSNAIAVIKG